MLTLDQIKYIIQANLDNDRPQYSGLSSSDIGRYNGALMWGEDGEAFDEDVYRAWAD